MQIISQLSIKLGFSAYRNTQTLNVSQYKTYQSNKRARTATIQPSKIPFVQARSWLSSTTAARHLPLTWVGGKGRRECGAQPLNFVLDDFCQFLGVFRF